MNHSIRCCNRIQSAESQNVSVSKTPAAPHVGPERSRSIIIRDPPDNHEKSCRNGTLYSSLVVGVGDRKGTSGRTATFIADPYFPFSRSRDSLMSPTGVSIGDRAKFIITACGGRIWSQNIWRQSRTEPLRPSKSMVLPPKFCRFTTSQ